MIAIVGYGSGNIRAITNLYKRINIETEVATSADDLLRASKIILPGVGSFDDSMGKLNRSGLREALEHQVCDAGIPVLGVCVGMQMMAASSEEGTEQGLAWFENSKVVRFDESELIHKPKLPHMGWNEIRPVNEHPIFEGVDAERGFYFLHSYKFVCESSDRLATSEYGGEFTSAINKRNIFGFQFHPEKSHTNGIKLFQNFARLPLC